jgi:hypothetical protein
MSSSILKNMGELIFSKSFAEKRYAQFALANCA